MTPLLECLSIMSRDRLMLCRYRSTKNDRHIFYEHNLPPYAANNPMGRHQAMRHCIRPKCLQFLCSHIPESAHWVVRSVGREVTGIGVVVYPTALSLPASLSGRMHASFKTLGKDQLHHRCVRRECGDVDQCIGHEG